MSQLRIAPIHRADLDVVADVHRRAFTDSAITALGHEAVRRYYGWLLDGPHDAALMGAWDRDQLVGFCAAGTFRGALSGYLRENRVYLALRLLTHPWLATNEIVRDRVRTGMTVMVRYRRRRKPAAQPPAAPPRFGVLAIATDPEAQGGGVGRALMSEAEERARRIGFDRMVLSVHPHNHRAVRFYEGLGWMRSSLEASWNGAMEKQLR
jgi:ribosomal protein S18 acetylase RimI-like enzyme